MTRTRKILLGAGAVALLAIVAAWFVLTGETFRAYVQQQLVLRLEKATGGKVSMRSFDLRTQDNKSIHPAEQTLIFKITVAWTVI